MDLEKKQPGVEINKPTDGGFWQRPNVRLALYLLLFAFFWLWWQSDMRMAREKVPYSDFLKYLEQGELDEVLVKDDLIEAKLKLRDEKTGKPKVIMTIPLANNELASMLEKHAVQYAVQHDNRWMVALVRFPGTS